MKANIGKINIEGIPAFRIETEDATAVVSPYGAHVLSFTVGEDDLLWVSGKSNFVEGKAIRGGIPVCWPWFGSAASPAHGLARISMWNMEAPRDEADGSVTLTMTLEKNGLAAKMVINIGRALTLNLTTVNNSAEPVKLTEALHTYFNISDISRIRILGFEDCDYFCSLAKVTEKQSGAITFDKETDRIYYAGSRIAVIDDPGLERQIRVERFGSDSAVVWNPWIAKAAAMPDFGDDEYPGMLCIEAANAGDDARTLAPGASHTLGTRISLI